MAINFPSPVVNGNTYDYNGVRYIYTKNGTDEGYWRVNTPGSVGIATSDEISVGTDSIKYVTPLGLTGTVEWDLLVDATATAIANTLAIRTASGNIVASPAVASGQVVTYDQLMGVGQTYQDMILSRSAGQPYTNNTGKPIYISVHIASVSNPRFSLTVDGVLVTEVIAHDTNNPIYPISAIIPNGSTYTVNVVSGSINIWTELRS